MLVIPSEEQRIGFGVFAAFCLTISLVCFLRGRPRQFFGSLIGLSLFLLGCSYIIEQLLGGPLLSSGRSEPSVVNAGLFTLFFGVPGLLYALRVRFGFASSNKGFNRTPESAGPAKLGEPSGGSD